jgi:hypothetical protein
MAYVDWDGNSSLTSESIVGVYGRRAKYVGETLDEGVVVVQLCDSKALQLISVTAVTVAPTEPQEELRKKVELLLNAEPSLTGSQAEALASALIEEEKNG